MTSNQNKNLNVFIEKYPNILPKKDPILDEALSNVNNFDLDVILHENGADYYKPIQCDDMYIFVLDNYELSEENQPQVLPQHLLTQFLYYSIVRLNSNVRISDRKSTNKEKNDLITDCELAMLSVNSWTFIESLSKSVLNRSDGSLKSVENEGSLFDIILKQTQSKNVNPLSIDILGNFLYNLRERVNYVSCGENTNFLKQETDFIIENVTDKTKDNLTGKSHINSFVRISQVTVLTNLKLKQNAWLRNHPKMLNQTLNFLNKENLSKFDVSDQFKKEAFDILSKSKIVQEFDTKVDSTTTLIVLNNKYGDFSKEITSLIGKIENNGKFVKISKMFLIKMKENLSNEEFSYFLNFSNNFLENLYYIAEYSIKHYVVCDIFTKDNKKQLFKLRTYALNASNSSDEKIRSRMPDAHKTIRPSLTKQKGEM